METRDLGRVLARRRWSAADGRSAITAWRRSGMTIAAFAQRHGLDEQRLPRWSRRVSVEQDVGLVPVVIDVNYSCRSPTTIFAGATAQGGDRPRRPRGGREERHLEPRAHDHFALAFAAFG